MPAEYRFDDLDLREEPEAAKLDEEMVPTTYTQLSCQRTCRCTTYP